MQASPFVRSLGAQMRKPIFVKIRKNDRPRQPCHAFPLPEVPLITIQKKNKKRSVSFVLL
jgi:hypothetical protein